MNKNFESLHQFVKGLRGDFDENAESNQSYVKGINGRLYSHNGTISYSSIKGTKKVYTNENIVSYHGFFAFNDELLIWVKVLPALATQLGGEVSVETIYQLFTNSFSQTMPFGDTEVTIDLEPHVNLNSFDIPIFIPAADPFDFSSNVSCVDNSDEEIDWSDYFDEYLDLPNLQVCPTNTESNLYENNVDFLDAIISLKKDNAGVIFDKVLWCGYQNWPLDAKIQTHGVDENNNLRRVYYTDFVNVYRVVNTKDVNLKYRQSNEFDTFQNAALLQPKIESIGTTGSIKASTVFYTYRMVTANGQQSAFAPFSLPYKVLADDSGNDYAGGDVSEVTNTSITIKLNIPSHSKFNEVEAFAIEYEAIGVPTAIRSLGILPSNEVVRFTHYGTEAEFTTDVTLSELTGRVSNWKYCSDITSSRNKMLAAALRNNPIPTNLLRITEDFALHGWDAAGETHNCLINPRPYDYRYIDPSMTDSLYFVYQKVYEVIQVFGTYTIFIKNVETEETFSETFTTTELEYRNVIAEIWTWLQTIIGTAPFIAMFPNLTITLVDDKILFAPTNGMVQTNMNNYVFNYSVDQVIEEINKDLRFLTTTVDTNNLVYGAVSLGFNEGNGVRISFRTESHQLMTRSTSSEMENFLNLLDPDDKKGFFKGEIYRTGLQIFDTDGQELFVIPLGDIMIPKIGEQKRGIDANGNAFFESAFYVNCRNLLDGTLRSEKIIMHVEVRLSCEIQKSISMYQLVYVERNEDNRTILAQGISAPMERCQTFFHSEYIALTEKINDKWNLPYYGGPTYDGMGLDSYDNAGAENEDDGLNNGVNRIVTHRSMIYFDAPDVIHGLVSAEKIKNGSIIRVAKLNTDHQPRTAIRSDGLGYSLGGIIPIVPQVTYPTYSRKILEDDIDFKDNYKPKWVNVSVFAHERPADLDSVAIKRAEAFLAGEQMAGFKFDSNFDVSNNALTLGRQTWYYSRYARDSRGCSSIESGARSELFNSNNYSIGMSTVVILGTEEIFTNEFIDMAPIPISGETHLSGFQPPAYDTHGLINIQLNNLDSVYGGRSELAYSKNVYIPLSETIPVLQTSNGIQQFKAYGDTYCTLFIRNKNYVSDLERGEKDMNNSGGCDGGFEEHAYTRTGAWFYAFVCETTVEPKMTYKDTAWKQNAPFNVEDMGETINEAYFQNTPPKTYIPRPFRFKDNPDLTNVVAVSDVKINGAFIDGWTKFRVNNFYELDKDKGAVLNLAKYLDNVYAIQKQQESLLILDAQSMIDSDNGKISVQQGDGNSISDHQVLSDFGTSIRRAVVDIISSSEKIKGFAFFDENKIEFVKITSPLLLDNSLHLKYFADFKADPIVDTEGYYDDEYKETNIRVRTKSGLGFVISYNEIFQCFNGHMEYNNRIYMVWNQEVFAPITASNTIEDPELTYDADIDLHQLNKGCYLNLFGEQKEMKLAILVNEQQQVVKIFPSWSGILNINYPVTSIELKTSLDQLRTVMSNHPRYIIREGRHTVPLKNTYDWADLRGNWMYLEVTVESIDNKKVDIYSFINFVRKSTI